MTTTNRNTAIASACALALMFVSPFGLAQSGYGNYGNDAGSSGSSASSSATASGDDVSDAVGQVKDATKVIQQMQSDQHMAALMQHAKGIFIVPDYARASLIVGGQGGEGVLVVRNGAKWSDPAFYDIGGVTIGAQAGASAGTVSMLLMTRRAVNTFKQNNNFAVNANTGLSIANYSARAQGSAGKGDVMVWSKTKGAYAGATVGLTDIRRDDSENKAYYQRSVSAQDIMKGKVSSMHSNSLHQVLPG